MQSPSPPATPSTSAPFVPPVSHGGGGSGKTATVLAAVALAVAVVAVGLNFVVAGPSTTPATGTPLWAVVGPNGTLARGSGVLNVTVGEPGTYNVTFVRSVSGCHFAASLGTTAAGVQPPGTAVVTVLTNAISEIAVTTLNSTGTTTNESFHVVALCPGTAPEIQFSAVVASNGDLVSGSAGANSSAGMFLLGSYGVEFPQSVAGCAYIVGLGESTSGTPPAGFVTSAQLGASANGVWVTTYSSSGAYSQAAFHLEVYC